MIKTRVPLTMEPHRSTDKARERTFHKIAPSGTSRIGLARVIDVDSLPADPLEALRELLRADVELEALRRARVEVARSQGATWDQIGESLGMSRQSAWEYYTRDARRVLDETAAGSDIGEDEAMRIATEEVSRLRRRRRSSTPPF